MSTDPLSTMMLSPGSVRCTLCDGRLSWPEERRLSMVIEAMTDHHATNHFEEKQ